MLTDGPLLDRSTALDGDEDEWVRLHDELVAPGWRQTGSRVEHPAVLHAQWDTVFDLAGRRGDVQACTAEDRVDDVVDTVVVNG